MAYFNISDSPPLICPLCKTEMEIIITFSGRIHPYCSEECIRKGLMGYTYSDLCKKENIEINDEIPFLPALGPIIPNIWFLPEKK